MKTGTKVMIGVAVLAGVGGIGYYIYKKKAAGTDPAFSAAAAANTGSQFMPLPGTTKLGAFVDGGYADYNAHVAAAYWKRQNEMYADKLRMAAMRGY